jgi:U6 snRNA-associated Sm-like protein LSm6|tara:strand:- start:213 stop:629 length:417 start_codon:yes stop_codon:yes gene_type:complete
MSGAAAPKNNPAEFLKQVLGRPVVVKLNSGVDYRGGVPPCPAPLAPAELASRGTGVLACLDGFMNIAMEQTEEYVNGQLKAKYGDAFIRGNNGATTRAHRHTQHTRTTAPLPLVAPLRLTVDPRVAAVLYISTTKRKA